MKNSVLKIKSFDFSLAIIATCKQMRKEHKEFVLINQLIGSGTAIGALVREAEYGQSRTDFISKMSIALKEANETEYWIELLKFSGDLQSEKYADLSDRLKEIIRLLIATVKTAKKNLKVTGKPD